MKRSQIKRSSKPMSKVSKKRKAEQKIYSEQRKIFLLQNPVCQIKSSECTWNSVEIHHRLGRGIYYLDQSTWLAACSSCHRECHLNPKWARDNGFMLDRLS